MVGLLSALFRALAPLWEMSLTAAYAAAVVALLRLVLKKRAPRQVLCLLWLVVFARLLVPVSFESPLSVLPRAQQELPAQTLSDGPGLDAQGPPLQGEGLSEEPVWTQAPGGTSGIPAGDSVQGTVPPPVPVTEHTERAPARRGFPWQAVLAGAWLAGALIMGGYGLASCVWLRRRLFDAIRAEDGAWEHPTVSSPFIFGMLRPKIYLPMGLSGLPRQFILCHERAHLRRLDHIVKPVCWAALAIHWFNPAVWLSFVLMSRDVEAACDEAVLREMGSEVKADYSATLLSLATKGRTPVPCSLAFDEGDARGRIRNVLGYRRPAVWMVAVSVLASALAAICLLTDPVAAKAPEDPAPSASQEPQAPEVSEPPVPEAYDVPAVPAAQPPVLADWAVEVLSGQRQFYDVGAGAWKDIDPLNAAYGFPDSFYDIEPKLAVLDLDGDGADEVVIAPTYGGYGDGEEIDYLYDLGSLILWEDGGQVYGHAPGYHALGELKADGTFYRSGSVGEEVGRARITPQGIETQPVTWCELRSEAGDGAAWDYHVDGDVSSKEAYEDALRRQQRKPGASWYRWFEDTGLLPITVGADQSAYVPRSLGAGQRFLYRQASTLYSMLFGESTAQISLRGGSDRIDWQDSVEVDGSTYVRATGRFARWVDLEATVLSLFTEAFWDACNRWEGRRLFIEVEGSTYFLPVSRLAGDSFCGILSHSEPAEQADGSIAFTLTGRYNTPRAGEDEQQWSVRSVESYDYMVEYPVHMVETQDGWRFSEFHSFWTDGLGYTEGHILWQTEPWAAVNGVMDEAVLRRAGTQVLLDWQGSVYPLDEEVDVRNFQRAYASDVDADGQTEFVLIYSPGALNEPRVVVYERSDHGLVRHAIESAALLDDLDQNTAVMRSGDGSVTLTCRSALGEGDSVVLSEEAFAGYEELREGGLRGRIEEFPYVGLSSEQPLSSPFCFLGFIRLGNGDQAGPYVASMSYFLRYDGDGFQADHLEIVPYEEFAVPMV